MFQFVRLSINSTKMSVENQNIIYIYIYRKVQRTDKKPDGMKMRGK